MLYLAIVFQPTFDTFTQQNISQHKFSLLLKARREKKEIKEGKGYRVQK